MKNLLKIKILYRSIRWYLYNLLTFWQSEKIVYVNTNDIKYGFKRDFSPFSTFRFRKPGNWDQEMILIKDHIVFKSMLERFVNKKSWDETPHYKMEMDKLKKGICSLKTQKELDAFFEEWDSLYESIKKNGLKSNRELYEIGIINNKLWILDEVTVNIARDGTLLLNSGWHRVIIAKLLGIPKIPVRILVTHSSYTKTNN